ncbi:MAG: flavodoxin family protein [Candidatus Thorarchaeota archaeon]
MKKVLIIYDTQFGNTRKLAFEIASGIQHNDGLITKVIEGHDLEKEDLSEYFGSLFGGPTRAFRATRGAMNSIKRAGNLGLDGKVVSTFGTYMMGDQSRGVKAMDKKLRKLASGAKVISPGCSAKVEGPTGPIVSEEIPRAHEWGQVFGQGVLQQSRVTVPIEE